MAKARTTATNTIGVTYATLQELQRERPAEDDITINGKTYRVRGMTNHEINNIVEWTNGYSDIPAIHLAKDEVLTVVYGLLRPSFGAVTREEVLASSLMVEQWPKYLSQKLAGRIRELTWPDLMPQEEPEPLPIDESVSETSIQR